MTGVEHKPITAKLVQNLHNGRQKRQDHTNKVTDKEQIVQLKVKFLNMM